MKIAITCPVSTFLLVAALAKTVMGFCPIAANHKIQSVQLGMTSGILSDEKYEYNTNIASFDVETAVNRLLNQFEAWEKTHKNSSPPQAFDEDDSMIADKEYNIEIANFQMDEAVRALVDGFKTWKKSQKNDKEYNIKIGSFPMEEAVHEMVDGFISWKRSHRNTKRP